MSRLLDVHNFIGEKLRWQQQVLHDRDLSPTAKVIGCQLMHDLNETKRGAWRSQVAIAELLHVNVRSVRRCMAELVAGGHLTTTPSAGRGHAIVYEALLKADNMPAFARENAGNKPAFPRSETRANRARKGGAGARPYLEETFNPPAPPTLVGGSSSDAPAASTSAAGGPAEGERRSHAQEARPHGLAGSSLVFVPGWVRERLVADPRWGESWVASWLDPCGFDEAQASIHPRSDFAAGRIRQEIGSLLRSWGLTIGEARGPARALGGRGA